MLGHVLTLDPRSRLERERNELLATIATEEAELAVAVDDRGEDTTASQHPADVASDLATRESTLHTELTLKAAVAAIDDALDRLARGTYGVSVECGASVDAERLAVLPQAARCMACQRHQERRGRTRVAQVLRMTKRKTLPN